MGKPTSFLQNLYENNLSNRLNFKSEGLASCDIRFINLLERSDRLSEFENQLKNIGVCWAKRVDAIKHRKASLGCSLSHFKLLTEYDKVENKILMVCEDDCDFLINREELDSLINDFVNNERLDVLCLSYNIRDRSNEYSVSELISVVDDIYTTSCYLLKPHMIDKFIEISLESISMLYKQNVEYFPIDEAWQKLQNQYVFSIPKNRASRQRRSFSNLENRITDYGV